MRRYAILLIIAVMLFISVPAVFCAEAQTELVTPRGNVKAGMEKYKLYKIFQEQDRLFSHRVRNEEWIVFRDWTSEKPKVDVITFFLKDAAVTGWKKAFVPNPKNAGSEFEYKHGEKIDKWFFPAGKSRWNGSEMTVIQWNMLTDTQKVMFITEYLRDLESKTGSHQAVDFQKYLLALNHYADTCSDATMFNKITDVLKWLLATDAKLDSGQSKR